MSNYDVYAVCPDCKSVLNADSEQNGMIRCEKCKKSVSAKKAYAASLKTCLSAARKGVAEAQYQVGEAYYCGHGVEVDYKKAIKYYLKAAKRNNVDALYSLGYCYENAQGVTQNLQTAIYYYKRAANLGHIKSEYKLGRIYEDKCQPADLDEAISWLLKAAEHGYVEAQYMLGYIYENEYEPADLEKAFKWYLKAAENGYLDAQCNVAACYMQGCGVEQNDKEEFKWLEKASQQGDAAATCGLAMCYKNGIGTEINLEKAADLYEQAAKQNMQEAQLQTGICYMYGEGRAQNIDLALMWFARVLRKDDNARAAFLLSSCLLIDENYSKCYYCTLNGDIDNAANFKFRYLHGLVWLWKAHIWGSEEAKELWSGYSSIPELRPYINTAYDRAKDDRGRVTLDLFDSSIKEEELRMLGRA